MVSYKVIENKKELPKKLDNYVMSAIAYALPSYIKFLLPMPLKDGSIIESDNKDVYIDGKKVGNVLLYKSGLDVSISHEFDIKYAGGYSLDGKTIYISANMPPEIMIGNTKVSLLESIGRHHELPEKWLLDDDYEYPYAHEIATNIEREYAESLGINWDSYNLEVDKLLRENYKCKLKKSPPNLDLSPYIYSHDDETIKEIRSSTPI